MSRKAQSISSNSNDIDNDDDVCLGDYFMCHATDDVDGTSTCDGFKFQSDPRSSSSLLGSQHGMSSSELNGVPMIYEDWSIKYQIVVPTSYWSEILSVAQDTLPGHLVVNKIYHEIHNHAISQNLKVMWQDFLDHVTHVRWLENQSKSVHLLNSNRFLS